MANTNFDHPIDKAIAQPIEGGEDTTGELDTYTLLHAAYPLRAQALYESGCDPITAQYLATGELPG